VVLIVPTTFEEEFVEYKKRIDEGKLLVEDDFEDEEIDEKVDCEIRMPMKSEIRTLEDGSTYELFLEKEYAVVECVGCRGKIEYVNHLRRLEGETGVRWFMTHK